MITMNISKAKKRLLLFPAREFYRMAITPQNNIICFESSPDYADNSWALFKYMVDNGYTKKYMLYWIADKHNEEIEKLDNVHVILRKDYTEAVKLLYRSKFVFYTHGMTGLIRIKDDQTVVNLWHGCGYKASRNKDVQKNKFSLKKLLNSSKMNFDYVLVPGEAFVKTKSVFFNCNEEQVLPLGYPRYDLISSACPQWAELKQAWGIDDNQFILWMPTYRKTGDNSYKENNMTNQYWLPLLHSDEELSLLNDCCAENHVKLVIKKHRLQSVFLKEGMQLSNIVFIDDSDLEKYGVQLYEILQFSDALITDYSSIAIDYLLLDKPIAFTLDDYEEYASKRGFVFEDARKYMPGHHVTDLDGINDFFSDVRNGIDRYQEARQEVLPELQNKCDGYSKRILEYFRIKV